MDRFRDSADATGLDRLPNLDTLVRQGLYRGGVGALDDGSAAAPPADHSARRSRFREPALTHTAHRNPARGG